MSLIKTLSMEEMIAIENRITAHAFDGSPKKEYRQPVEKILEPWQTAKSQFLYRMFGEQLILSKEIEFAKSADMLEEQIAEEMFDSRSAVSKPFIDAYYGLCSYNGELHGNWNAERLIGCWNLALNRWDHTEFTIPVKEGNDIRVQRGAKISKILGKIAKAYNLPGYEEFRILHSQILNQKKLTGHLCLSIHPLDFITMSDNDNGWTSCMNWEDWGEYRQGTVEMMNSQYVICAYLDSKTPYMLKGGFEWSNKKWRELFIVSKDVITGVKGYPYQNEYIVAEVLKWLRELAETNLNWKYGDQVYEYCQGEDFFFNGNEDKHHLLFHTDNMYNDFGRSHYAYINPDLDENFNLNYSGVSECMCCGNTLIELDGESGLVCLECEEVYRCVECGGRYDGDDLIDVNGHLYCSDCYHHYIEECPICGDEHRTYDMVALTIAQSKDEICFGRSYTEISVCDDCVIEALRGQPSERWSKYFSNVYEAYRGFARYVYVVANECTEAGLELFGFDSLEEFKESGCPTFSPTPPPQRDLSF